MIGEPALGEMEKAWQPQAREQEMYRAWEEAGLFRADATSGKPHYSIVMPPPNVTGELHLGHAVNDTVQDVYARYKRMRGFEVLWLPGTDHAAIATQNVIEKQLAREGTTKEQLGRAAFEKRVEAWYGQVGQRIVEQLKRLGMTADWSRLRFTMDPAYVRAVREAFVRLYDKGYIYRGPRIVNWCPRDRSSISDLEVEWREAEDTLYHIRYEMADGDGALVVATVRPETMLADTAVAVNPDDERYKRFVGRTAILPLVGRELPVVADAYADPKFGTGALKVTPGHDANDYEIGRRHDLPILSCIDKDGNIVNEEWVPDELRTRDAATARGRIVELLRQSDHLVRTEPYTHEVGHCDRCGTVIEPLVDEQWWCSMKEMAGPATEAVERGDITFVPARWNAFYLDWMRNLRDWNVSRQLWLGHRLPIYYCDAEGLTFASVDETDSCPKCGGGVRQETDVLDTWFSSALWPFATMGWPEDTEDLRAFNPTDILGTAWEIIRLWVARMIMTSLEFRGVIPFHHVLIHTVIQDPQGQRMSKSKGNGVDPLEMVDRYGADAVRAWASEAALPRQAVRFDEDRIRSFQLFANKYWNIARFVLSNSAGMDGTAIGLDEVENPFDRWILVRLDQTITTVTSAIEDYRPADAVRALYEFARSDFADWYLEAIKGRLRDTTEGPAGESRRHALRVARHVLDMITRMLHPFMPYVTEAVWQRMPGPSGAAAERAPMIAGEPTWPQSSAPAGADDHADELARIEALFDVIRQVRDAATSAGVKGGEKPILTLRRVAEDPSSTLVDAAVGRDAIARLATVELGDGDGDGAAPFVTFVAAGLELRLSRRAATATVTGDAATLARQLDEARAEVTRLEAQLADARFTERAPGEVVERARTRLLAATRRVAALREALGA